MALTGSDLLVVQQQTGNQDIKSLSITDLKTFLDTQSPLNFKGTANMTVSGDEPAVSDRVAGNVYINSATSAGTFAWTGGTDPFEGTVQPNAQAVWVDVTGWAVSNNAIGDVGVETIEATAPIEVDDTTAASPRISILAADVTRQGSVQIATDDDVTNGTPNLVVTSEQLAAAYDAIGQAGGGTVVSVGANTPLSLVDASKNSTTPVIQIQDGTTGQKGAVQFQDATEIKVAEDAKGATPKYVDAFYLVKDFATLESI